MPEAPPTIDPAAEALCATCGGRLVPGGTCTPCLLRLAMAAGNDQEDPLFDTLRWQGFGDYEVIEEIARGGMGVVYRARQLSLERDVALKMILAGELAGKKALRMFQTEAQAAANLHHPNIVPVYEIGEHEMQNYFTMRYVPGGRTVADWADTRREDPRAIAAVAAKVARAVSHAHERGILHCDLKPSNVLWDPRGEPVITDFGLAKLLDRADPAHTHSGEIVGSPSYMAPEQIDRRAGAITTATDVYGIGALLYEMLAGRPPFTGGSTFETLRNVSQDTPRSIPGIPEDLHVICLKCLAKRAEDRYSSAAALAEDLEHFVRGEPVSAVPLTGLQTLWRWALRKPRSAALLALCAISMLFGMTGIVWQWLATQRANKVQAEALARVRWQEIERWINDGDHSRALAYLASLIRENPGNWRAVMYAMSIVDQSSQAVPVGPDIVPPAKSTTSARLSVDGNWAVTAGDDALVRLWDTTTGEELRQIEIDALATALATGAGGALAIATEEGDVRVLPALRGEAVSLPRMSSTPVEELSFSADGRRLLARTATGLEVWSMDAMKADPRYLTLDGRLKGAKIARDGVHVLGWSSREACVWDTVSSERLVTIPARKEFVNAALSARGNRVALIDGEFHIRVWDVAGQAELSVAESPLSAVRHVVLDGAGERMTVGGNGNELTLYDAASGLPLSKTARHRYYVSGLLVDAEGKRVYSCGSDDTMCVSDARTGQSLVSLARLGHMLDEVALSPSGRGERILVHGRIKKLSLERIRIWQGTQTEPPKRQVVKGQRDSYSSRLSPDGRLGALGLHPGDRCYIYELDTGRVVLDERAQGDVYAVFFSPDMTKCYALTANGGLHGWTLATGKSLWPPNVQPGKIRPATMTPDGTRIIIGHNDGHIRIYDTATGKVVQVLDHPGEIKTLRLSPRDPNRLLSGSTDGLAHVWDLRRGKILQTFQGHQHIILASAWSPDGKYVATASHDRTVRVWEAETGRAVGVPLQHSVWLAHLEFSPDGLLLATACRDGTARFWHPLTGKPASLPMLQGSTCETVRFTADGAAILVRDHSGFRFWDTIKGEPLTIHYSEPASGGLGMDSESYRDIMNGDGTQVFLGGSMNYGALWKISQPRGFAPPWFANFIEVLAGVGQDEDTAQRNEWLELRESIQKSTDTGLHSLWAKKILGMPAP